MADDRTKVDVEDEHGWSAALYFRRERDGEGEALFRLAKVDAPRRRAWVSDFREAWAAAGIAAGEPGVVEGSELGQILGRIARDNPGLRYRYNPEDFSPRRPATDGRVY